MCKLFVGSEKSEFITMEGKITRYCLLNCLLDFLINKTICWLETLNFAFVLHEFIGATCVFVSERERESPSSQRQSMVSEYIHLLITFPHDLNQALLRIIKHAHFDY